MTDVLCILGRALDSNPEKCHLERVSKHLKHVYVELGLVKIKIPVSLKDITKIEKKFNVAINVFGFKGRDIYPLGKSKESPGKKMVILLFVSNKKKKALCADKKL